MSPVSRSRKKKSKGSGRRRQEADRRKARAALVTKTRELSSGRYWHGGLAGLEPGTILVPRAVAEQEGVDLRAYEAQPGYELGVTDAERVYFSSSREFARGFAGQIQAVDQETGVVGAHGCQGTVGPAQWRT